MKKTLLTVLTILTLVCLFAFGASAYETEYYSIDVPDTYTCQEADGTVTFASSDAVITIICTDAEGESIANITATEQVAYDDLIKQTYSAYGTVNNYESYFESEGDAGMMAFTFEIADSTITSDTVTAEGILYTENDLFYHIVVLIINMDAYDEVQDILDTLEVDPYAGAGSADTSEPEVIPSDPVTAPSEIVTTEAPAEADTTETPVLADDDADKDDDKDDDKDYGGLDMNVLIIAVAAVAVVAIVAVVVVKKKK